MINTTLKERFESRVMPEPNTGCWIWIGWLRTNQYGAFWLSGKYRSAHRISYALYKGEIPTGLNVCHICDVSWCVNPDHLFLGTQRDNIHDMIKKKRRVANTKLTENAVREIREQYALGKNQYVLAKEFGIHQSHVSNIINFNQRRAVL